MAQGFNCKPRIERRRWEACKAAQPGGRQGTKLTVSMRRWPSIVRIVARLASYHVVGGVVWRGILRAVPVIVGGRRPQKVRPEARVTHCARLWQHSCKALLHCIDVPIAMRMTSEPRRTTSHARLREGVQVREIKVACQRHVLAIMPGNTRYGPHHPQLRSASAARLAAGHEMPEAALHFLRARASRAARFLGNTSPARSQMTSAGSRDPAVRVASMLVQHDCAARRWVLRKASCVSRGREFLLVSASPSLAEARRKNERQSSTRARIGPSIPITPCVSRVALLSLPMPRCSVTAQAR